MMSKMTPSSNLQSGTLNVIQAPNLCFLSQIISDLDQTFRIDPLANNNLIYDVINDSILQAPDLYFLSQIMSNLDQTLRIGRLATSNLIYDAKDDPILQVSSQETSMSSK